MYYKQGWDKLTRGISTQRQYAVSRLIILLQPLRRGILTQGQYTVSRLIILLQPIMISRDNQRYGEELGIWGYGQRSKLSCG
jgi:hypothetical protein